jgi:tetratricopeptide (TPR) repeat protein
MVGKTWMLLGLSWIGGLPLWAAPAPAPMHVIVTVINKHADPGQPVPGVRIAIDFVDGSQKITEARDRTNSQGQTELIISPEALQRGDLHIEISDAPNLVVYQPGEGILTDVHPTLTIVLLPKGSPALLQPAQIEAMLNRLSRLSIQNQQLVASLRKAENQKPAFDQALNDWAAANGLPYNEVNDRVQAWASDVLAHREQASLVKQAEAEMGLRHYDRAAVLFQTAADENQSELDHERNAFIEQQRERVRTMLQNRSQAANMLQLAHDFHNASLTMDKARASAAAEHRSSPSDPVFRHLWLWCTLLTEYSHWKEGQSALTANGSSTTNASEILTAAVADSKATVDQMDQSTDSDLWGYAHAILAVESIYLAEVSNSQQAAQLRAQAIAASHAALQAFSKDQDPKTWGYFQVFYALSLAAQAARSITDGHITMEQAEDLLEQANAGLRAALDVYSPTQNPKEWASLQSSLAWLLDMQSLMPQAQHAVELSMQAEAAARAALSVLNSKDQPDDWGTAQGTLGGILAMRAEKTPGPQASELFAQASAAYRAVLTVRNKQDDALKWANVQHDLADLLQDQAESTNDAQSIDLLTQSIAAYRAEMEVLTKASFPQRWARAQDNLGHSLAMLGIRTEGDQSAHYLAEAATAYNSALLIFTRQDYPERWARTQRQLAGVLANQGVRTTGTQSTELLAQAATAYSSVLDVLTKENSAPEWAEIQRNFAQVRMMQGARSSSATQSKEFFTEAAKAYTAALEVVPKNPELLVGLSSIYHEYLFDFPNAYEYTLRAEAAQPTVGNKLDLAEAALTTSRFTNCIDLSNSLNEAQLDPKYKPTYLILLLACQWGAGQHAAASQTADLLASSASALSKSGWNTTGDRTYLATAPEFSANRPAWIKLFQSLEQGDGPSLADAAHTIHQGAGN